MDEQNEYTIVMGIFDVITKSIRTAISKAKENDKPLGIGVYTTEYCDKVLFTHPMMSDEHRMQIVSGLDGVDFVFTISNLEESKKKSKEAYINYLNETIETESKKKYKVGFVIGSFDLLHAGHIENINLASRMCEELYVVLKTDERIIANKHKIPMQNTTKRAENLRSLKEVKNIVFMDMDSSRKDVLDMIIDKYKEEHPEENLDKREIVAIFGEDLKEKEIEREEWEKINVVFTSRSPEKMKTVSSTAYQGKVQEGGGIGKIENLEDSSLIIGFFDEKDEDLRDNN